MVDIRDLLDRFQEQVKRIELTVKFLPLQVPPSPDRVDTPSPEYDYNCTPRTRVFNS